MTNLFGTPEDRLSAFDTDQESVLLAALEKTTSRKFPTGDSILEEELLKNSSGSPSTNVRSTPIESPSPAPDAAPIKSADRSEPTIIQIKPIQVEVISTAATTGRVTDAAMAGETNPAYSNNSTSVTNTSITNNLPKDILSSTSNSAISSSNLLTESSKIIRDAISSVTNNSLVALTNSFEKSKNESSQSIEKRLSNLASFASSVISDTTNSSNRETLDRDTITNNLTQIRSSKLVDSSNVKKILAPDKTLEASVTSLSKSLPEAVNNLSNSVTSISPQTNSSTSVMNEGTKIDQSSQTIITKGPDQVVTRRESDAPQNMPIAPGINNEYYLQAIYSALMSGKVKVKLEYQ